MKQALAIEFTSSMTVIFLATGIGLDPRQKVVFGQAGAPILIGLSLGITSFCSGFFLPGYTGACESSSIPFLC